MLWWCFCSSDNGSFFGGYIGVGTLVDDLFEWSSSVGFYVALRQMIWKQIQYDDEQKIKDYI